MEIKTTNDLRAAYPDLVASIENDAAAAERTRIQEIEDATMPGAENLATEAKFTKPVDSATFVKNYIASMKAKQKEQSASYLKQAENAANASGANDIGNPPPANPEPENAKRQCPAERDPQGERREVRRT